MECVEKYHVFFRIVYTKDKNVVIIQEADMRYKIVIDSCGELTDTLKEDPHYENVAL